MSHKDSGWVESISTPSVVYGDISAVVSFAVNGAIVIANLFPVFVVCTVKRPRERLVTDELVATLGVTEIVSVIVPMPFAVISYFHKEWWGGRRTCYVHQIVTVWGHLASMFLVTLLCVDRCVTLNSAVKRSSSTRYQRNARLLIAMVFILALSISLLPLIGLAPEGLRVPENLCQPWVLIPVTSASLKEHIFYIAFLGVSYFNVLLSFFANLRASAHLSRLKRHHYGDRWPSAFVDQRVIMECTRMIAVVAFIFYLMWLPALVLVTMSKVGYAIPPAIVMYALLATSITGLLNPLLYTIFCRSYRRGYYRLLRTCCCTIVLGCPDPEANTRHVREMPHANGTVVNRRSGLEPDTGHPGAEGAALLEQAEADDAAMPRSASTYTTVGSADYCTIRRSDTVMSHLRSPSNGDARPLPGSSSVSGDTTSLVSSTNGCKQCRNSYIAPGEGAAGCRFKTFHQTDEADVNVAEQTEHNIYDTVDRNIYACPERYLDYDSSSSVGETYFMARNLKNVKPNLWKQNSTDSYTGWTAGRRTGGETANGPLCNEEDLLDPANENANPFAMSSLKFIEFKDDHRGHAAKSNAKSSAGHGGGKHGGGSSRPGVVGMSKSHSMPRSVKPNYKNITSGLSVGESII